MAQAPTPGVTRRADERKAATVTLILTLRGETLRLCPATLSFAERTIVRKATGMPFESYFSEIGQDSVEVAWWLARRAAGEPGLTLEKSVDQMRLAEAVEADEFELVVDDGDEGSDDPQP